MTTPTALKVAPARHSAILFSALLIGAMWLGVPFAGAAETDDSAPEQRLLPDAEFDATFEKYAPPSNIYSPYYSWEARMALNVTVFRKGEGAVNFGTVFQTVGTENLGSRVGVGGTGYLLRLGYARQYSDTLTLSAGLAHLSSHLTRDLDKKLEEQRELGAAIPVVDDASEYNVPFVEGYWRLTSRALAPELQVDIEPVNFRFTGGRARYVRPLYFHSRWALWRGSQKSLVADTHHEVGKRPVNAFSVTWHLAARNQTDGRFQIFVIASPGRGFHVSPNVGGLRDGIAFGIRMSFRA